LDDTSQAVNIFKNFEQSQYAFKNGGMYIKFEKCKELVEHEEMQTGILFDWVIRSRPDLYFYGDLPKLSSLNSNAIYSRMRCFDFNGPFHLDAYSSEIQYTFQNGECDRDQWWYPLSEECQDPFVMDDQFAILPRIHLDAYFRNHEKAQAKWDWKEQKLTNSLLSQNISVLPIALPFTIARSSEPKHVPSMGIRMGELIMSHNITESIKQNLLDCV